MKPPSEIGKAIAEVNLSGALEGAIEHLRATPANRLEEEGALLLTQEVVPKTRSAAMKAYREENKGLLDYLRSIGHPQAVMDNNIEQMATWQTARLKNLDDYVRNLRDSDREHTRYLGEKFAVFRAHVHGSDLSVLELGARTDVSAPKLLQPQIGKYTSIDIDSNPILVREWNALADRHGIARDRHFHVAGNAAQLPVASGSQDLVFTSRTNPFIFSNDMSEEMHERSVAEAARVLKPGGKFIMRPFGYRNQLAGEDLLAKYFPQSEVHIPTAEDRAEIQRLVGKRQFRSDDKDGDFRSFVGTKG